MESPSSPSPFPSALTKLMPNGFFQLVTESYLKTAKKWPAANKKVIPNGMANCLARLPVKG